MVEEKARHRICRGKRSSKGVNNSRKKWCKSERGMKWTV
jgi:hypothetical protein